MSGISTETFAPQAAPTEAQTLLRARIGWLCQIIRALAAIWVFWVLFDILRLSDRASWLGNYGRYVGADLSSISQTRYLLAFALEISIWLFVAATGLAIWRLFSIYLSGQIFTVDAALWLRRIGAFGGATVMASLLVRPAVEELLTAGIAVQRHHGWVFTAEDMLHVIFVTFIFSLAFIFKTAAELVEEHAQIV